MGQRGRKHVPTDIESGKVVGYAATGTPQTIIAIKLGITVKTLEKHYKTELAVSQAERVNEVANTTGSRSNTEGPHLRGLTRGLRKPSPERRREMPSIP